MTKNAERYIDPSQDEAYSQFTEEYWGELDRANQGADHNLDIALDQARKLLAKDRPTAVQDVSRTLNEALQVNATLRCQPLETITDNFYAIATPEDTATLDEAAGYYYLFDFERAYDTIDTGATSPAARTAMRTAMDRFTVDILDGSISKAGTSLEAGNTQDVLTAYDFIKQFASSESAQLALFSKIDAAVSESIYSSTQASLPHRLARTTAFVETAASSETTRQALRFVNDLSVLKTARRAIWESQSETAAEVVEEFSSSESKSSLQGFVQAEHNRYTDNLEV